MIRPYQDQDKQAVLDLFLAVQEATDGLYPDQEIIDIKYGEGVEGVEAWLDSNPNKSAPLPERFVYQEGDNIIGYYQIDNLADEKKSDFADYWRMAFSGFDTGELAVIKKLGVAPDFWGNGYGRELVDKALEQIRAMGQRPAAVCLEHREHAREIFTERGGLLVANFPEVTGARAVSYIFKDD